MPSKSQTSGTMNRRRFLYGAALAGTWSMLPAAAHTPLPEFVFEMSNPRSVALARHVMTLGAITHGIRNDATALWMDEFRPRWRYGAEAIAGVTFSQTAFDLDVLGRDAGLHRIVHRRLDAVGLPWDTELVSWLLVPRRRDIDDFAQAREILQRC